MSSSVSANQVYKNVEIQDSGKPSIHTKDHEENEMNEESHGPEYDKRNSGNNDANDIYSRADRGSTSLGIFLTGAVVGVGCMLWVWINRTRSSRLC